jgi:dihydroneopterin aldolase / 2-amino-4-hydroxy-6-hydroxymethyldihydropteridine diphosphokinase
MRPIKYILREGSLIDTHLVYLGLGSNLGNRKHNLEEAIRQVGEFASIKKISSIYETEPWGLKDQPTFLNQVILIESTLGPTELLTCLKKIERQMGRKKSVRFGPRLIDLDILFFDDLIMQTDVLTIPHPLITERAFVLVPLAEIAPEFMHPLFNKTIMVLLRDVDQKSVLLSKD